MRKSALSAGVMHPTKLAVLRMVEETGEMDCNEIAVRLEICGKQARTLTRALVLQGYLRERQQRRSGNRGAPNRRVVWRSDLAIEESVVAPDEWSQATGDSTWWPSADLVVETAMREMLRVGHGAPSEQA
ncbi:hypothetical protein [Paraburkholderia pallida]|uniref:MarR family transcriptional regulator n=1 Tax=Paraburkholderia pallida TaxID=2547399 RepID=A0A4P7CYL8_9BURK|nr:hypothetical protein [Paraburkholderia pallida]QBQ99231.1 hypothetical protein E1956_18680 [Paraburkholderia pallida]